MLKRGSFFIVGLFFYIIAALSASFSFAEDLIADKDPLACFSLERRREIEEELERAEIILAQRPKHWEDERSDSNFKRRSKEITVEKEVFKKLATKPIAPKPVSVTAPPEIVSVKPPTKKKLPFDFGGYYKNLLIASKSLTTEEKYYSDTQRLRLEARKNFLGDKLQIYLAYDVEGIFGDIIDLPDFDNIKDVNQKDLAFIDLDKVFVDKSDFYAKQGLYRGYLKYYTPEFQLTAGKQRIDWGRCRFWSPMDLFNPVNPLSIERDEAVGVDALDIGFSPGGPVQNIDLVYAPQEDYEDTSFASRLYAQSGSYDFFLMAGEFKKDEVIGGSFDGHVGEGGVRGEFTVTRADIGDNYFRGVIGADYNLPNNVYVLGEYYYDGGGGLTIGKHFLNLYINYEVTPLVDFYFYNIYDIDGESFFLNPEVKYNIITNLDLSAGAQIFSGNSGSEFGDYKNTYYMQAQYFF